MVYGLLGGLWWWSTAPTPPPINDAPRGVVLSDTVAATELAPDAGAAMSLRADQVVSVQAVSTTLRPGQDKKWWAWPMLLVSDGTRSGWVSSEHVATEQHFSNSDWPGEFISRRALGGGAVWSAAHTGYEIDDEDGVDWFRADTTGWLVMERGGRVERLPLVADNGWGSGHRIEGIVWRDLTGDGQPEALIEVLETVSEVGASGRTLHVLDFSHTPLAPLLSIPVDDPPWNHVGSRDRLGWVDVFPEAGRIQKTAVQTHNPAHGIRQLSKQTQQWQWDGTAFSHRETTTTLKPMLSAGPIYAEPDGPVAALLPQQPVVVDEYRGRFIEGEAFWVQVRDTNRAALGWVRSTRLVFSEKPMQEFFSTQRPEAPDYVRYDWER